jgi:hypothetical protein
MPSDESSSIASSSVDGLSEDVRFPNLRKGRKWGVFLIAAQSRIRQAGTLKEQHVSLLFGCAEPLKAVGIENKWNLGERSSWTKLSEVGAGILEARLCRLSVYIDSVKIPQFFDLMANGKSLVELSVTLDLKDLPPDFEQLRVGATQQLKIRPPIFVESSTFVTQYNELAGPGSSLLGEVPTYVCAVRLLDKDAVVRSLVPVLEPKLEQTIWNYLGEAANRETGLDFFRRDAGRLGDFELTDAPSGDVYGNCAVTFRVRAAKAKNEKDKSDQKATHVVDVIIQRDLLSFSPITRAYLQCRLRNDNDVVLDEIVAFTPEEPSKHLSFVAGEPVGSIEVSLWVGNNSDRACLLYQGKASIIRQIPTGLGVVTASGRIRGAWAKANPGPDTAAVEAFQKVEVQTHTVGGWMHDPWVPVAREQRTFMRGIHPDTSGAEFFKAGWEIRFADWLKKCVSEWGSTRVLLVDPYLDAEALIKVFGRAAVVNAKYQALTAFNHRPRSPFAKTGLCLAVLSGLKGLLCLSKKTNAAQSASRSRLLLTCQQSSSFLPPDFTIFELLPKGTSSDQIFHDRYLFFFNQSGKEEICARAFLLSNSVQGAALQHPVAVLPLPPDILLPILEYVDGLLKGRSPTGKELKIETLWSQVTAAASKRMYPSGPDLSLIASGLLRVTPRSVDDAAEALQRAHLYDVAGKSFDGSAVLKYSLTQISSPEGRSILTHEFWAAIAEISHHVPQDVADALSSGIVAQQGDEIGKLLVEVIVQASRKPAPLGTFGHEASIEELMLAQGLASPFDTIFDNIREPINIARPSYSNPAIFHATQQLCKQSPKMLVTAVSGLRDEYRRSCVDGGATPASGASARVISVVLGRIAECLSWRDCRALEGELIASEIPLLRALAAVSITQRLSPEGSEAREADWRAIDALETTERIRVLGRLRAQLRRSITSRMCSPSYAILCRLDAMIEKSWPIDANAARVRELALALEINNGPEETCSLLEGLVATGKLDGKTAYTLWLQLLSERMKNATSTERVFTRRDRSLTVAGAYAFLQLDLTSQTAIGDELARVAQRSLRELREPFGRFTHVEWWPQVETALWILSFCELLEFMVPNAGDAVIPNQLRDARRNLDQILDLFPSKIRKVSVELKHFRDALRGG